MAEADPYQVRPSARWYALVVVAWLIAAVCVFFAMKPFFDVLTVTPIPTGNRAAIDISDDGLTVYATSSVSGASLCSLSDADGNVVSLESVTENATFEVTAADGTRMYPIATTPRGLAPGTYTLRCAGIGGVLLGRSDRIDFDSVLLQVGGMFLLSGGFGVAGLVVLIVVLVKRHNSKDRARWAQAAYAGWGQWYASPYAGYPGYPQQGYPQQGYPQQGYPQQGYPPQSGPQQSGPASEPPSDDRPPSDPPPDAS